METHSGRPAIEALPSPAESGERTLPTLSLRDGLDLALHIRNRNALFLTLAETADVEAEAMPDSIIAGFQNALERTPEPPRPASDDRDAARRRAYGLIQQYIESDGLGGFDDSDPRTDLLLYIMMHADPSEYDPTRRQLFEKALYARTTPVTELPPPEERSMPLLHGVRCEFSDGSPSFILIEPFQLNGISSEQSTVTTAPVAPAKPEPRMEPRLEDLSPGVGRFVNDTVAILRAADIMPDHGTAGRAQIRSMFGLDVRTVRGRYDFGDLLRMRLERFVGTNIWSIAAHRRRYLALMEKIITAEKV